MFKKIKSLFIIDTKSTPRKCRCTKHTPYMETIAGYVCGECGGQWHDD